MAESKSASIVSSGIAGATGLIEAVRKAWPTTRTWRRHLESPRTFLIAVAALLTITALWAALFEVDQVVRVDGRIVPAGRSQQIQHLEGGIVATIATFEGATVRKGDLLLTIDATTAEATVSETEVKLIGQRLRAARLQAEAENIPTLTLPPDLAAAPTANIERQLFASRRDKTEQELRIQREQIRQRSAELREIELRRERLTAELTTARQRSAIVAGLVARNAASKLEQLEAQSREQRLGTELSDADSTVPKLRAALAESEARIEEARLRQRTEAQAELSGTLVEIDRLRQIVTAQADRANRTEVRAPVAGIVNRIAVNTVGGVVKPGDTIVEITPMDDQLLIEAKARPSDRGDLRAGLGTKVRVSAHDVGRFGTLDGRVVDVSADTVSDSRGDDFYRVVIRVDALPESFADRLLVPGMTVTGDIVTGRRTLLEHLTSPLNKFTYNAFRDAR